MCRIIATVAVIAAVVLSLYCAYLLGIIGGMKEQIRKFAEFNRFVIETNEKFIGLIHKNNDHIDNLMGSLKTFNEVTKKVTEFIETVNVDEDDNK